MEAIEIGECIYCRARDIPLSREHVIPYGLWGDLVLRDASCADCARETSEVEGRVLRGNMLGFRAVLDAPTRDRRDRPTSFPAEVQRDGEWLGVDLPIPEYTGTAVFPIFDLPAAWTQRPDHELTVKGHYVALASESTRTGGVWTPAHQANADAVRIPVKYDPVRGPVDFARFVGKVAHGYAVALFGLDGFVPTAVPAILGRSDDIGAWVGTPGASLFEEAPNRGHRVRVGDDRNGGVIAGVHLFADSGAPEYLVCVGRLP
jgi:hypothetical protein